MSAIEAINSDTSLSYLSSEESGKRASEQQVDQMTIMVQSMVSSLSEHMLMGSSATSETSVDSMSSEPSSSTTTDTSTTTGDETSSTASDGATDTTDSTTSSDEPTQQQQLAFQLGETLVQTVTGISSDACKNQSSQDGDQDV